MRKCDDWSVREDPEWFQIVSEDDITICAVREREHAYLIAAAPKLFLILQEILPMAGTDDVSQRDWERVTAEAAIVIALAKGKTK